MFQVDVIDQVEFLVIDNNPSGQHSAPLRQLCANIPNAQYYPFSGYAGTAVKDLIFRIATAELVLCLDSHVLVDRGAAAAVIKWFDDDSHHADLLQGPLLTEDHQSAIVEMLPEWRTGMWGIWAGARSVDDLRLPSAVEMQGLGLFACRRLAWPGLNPRLRGSSATEGYLHEKFRRNGGQVVCHKDLGWLHRFDRPAGIRYPNRWLDRIRNYYISWNELGWNERTISEHFDQCLSEIEGGSQEVEKARNQAAHPMAVLDTIFCLSADLSGCDHSADMEWLIEHCSPIGGLPPLAIALEQAARRNLHTVMICDGREPLLSEVHVKRIDRQLNSDPIIAVVAVSENGNSGNRSHTESPGTVAEEFHKADLHRIRDHKVTLVVRQTGFRNLIGLLRQDLASQSSSVSLPNSLSCRSPGDDLPLAARHPAIENPDGTFTFDGGPNGPACTMNSTAAAVLQLCDGRNTVFDISNGLARSFEIASKNLDSDVAYAIEELRRAGLLEPCVHARCHLSEWQAAS